jgi:hypothetical protein
MREDSRRLYRVADPLAAAGATLPATVGDAGFAAALRAGHLRAGLTLEGATA